MQWFISSVTNEMLEHRRAVASAIRYLRERRGLDLIPFRMEEDYPSPSDHPQTSFLEELDKCQAMVLILGPKYGRKGDNGLSATHKEFHRATQAGKLITAFYDDRLEEYDPDERNFLDEVFTLAQGYAFDGTSQNLETVVQRVLEEVYRGTKSHNPLSVDIEGRNLVKSFELPQVAILTSKVAPSITLDGALENALEVDVQWLHMATMHINRPRTSRISRHYYETVCSFDGISEMASLGRLYDNGEILFITTQPFISFNDIPPKPTYSNLINGEYLQKKLADFLEIVLKLAQNHQGYNTIQLRLSLLSNKPMQLRLNNPYTQISRLFLGKQVSIESDNTIEEFEWKINLSQGLTGAIQVTREHLLPDLYRTFHYSAPELYAPFGT